LKPDQAGRRDSVTAPVRVTKSRCPSRRPWLFPVWRKLTDSSQATWSGRAHARTAGITTAWDDGMPPVISRASRAKQADSTRKAPPYVQTLHSRKRCMRAGPVQLLAGREMSNICSQLRCLRPVCRSAFRRDRNARL